MRLVTLPLSALALVCLSAPVAGQREATPFSHPSVAFGRSAPELREPVRLPSLARARAAAGGGLPGAGFAIAQEDRSTGVLIAGGLLGGAVGFFGGGIAGAAIACESADPEEDLCAVGGFLIGATIAESVLLPLGVHVANERRGDYLPSLLASMAVAGAGIAVAAFTEEGAYLIPVPVLQLVFSIALERSSAEP